MTGSPDQAVVVRPAQPGDEAAIARVHVRSWQDGYRGLLPDDRLDALDETIERRVAHWRRLIDDRPQRRLLLVAAAGETVVGFATAGPASNRDVDAGTVAELYAIYLEPAWFGRGVGSALWQEVAAGLCQLGFTSAVLWVFAGNERARRFYEARGWSKDGAEMDDIPGWEGHLAVRYRIDLQGGSAQVAK